VIASLIEVALAIPGIVLAIAFILLFASHLPFYRKRGLYARWGLFSWRTFLAF